MINLENFIYQAVFRVPRKFQDLSRNVQSYLRRLGGYAEDFGIHPDIFNLAPTNSGLRQSIHDYTGNFGVEPKVFKVTSKNSGLTPKYSELPRKFRGWAQTLAQTMHLPQKFQGSPRNIQAHPEISRLTRNFQRCTSNLGFNPEIWGFSFIRGIEFNFTHYVYSASSCTSRTVLRIVFVLKFTEVDEQLFFTIQKEHRLKIMMEVLFGFFACLVDYEPRFFFNLSRKFFFFCR